MFSISFINNAIDYGQYLWIIHIFNFQADHSETYQFIKLNFSEFLCVNSGFSIVSWVSVFFFFWQYDGRRWNGVYLHIKNYDKKTEVILPLYGLKRNKPQRKRKEIILKVFLSFIFSNGWKGVLMLKGNVVFILSKENEPFLFKGL